MLDMVRVEAGGLQLNLQPVDLAEAVAAAADQLKRELKGHPIGSTFRPTCRSSGRSAASSTSAS